MKSILKLFSEHGTLIQPDALKYISSKKDPDEFASFLIKNLKEYPLILTVENIKHVEESTKVKEIPKLDDDLLDKKKLQNKILSEIFNSNALIEEVIDEDEYDDPDKEDELKLNNGDKEKKTPHAIEISAAKGWKPLSNEYESEIEILKDVTGKSTCEGTTQDFVKLFRDRYTVLQKIIRSQRREMTNVIPINRIKKNLSDVQLIGIVKNVKTTVNGHKLIEIEDETGTATLMALKNNNEVIQLANEVIVDEIIGMVGKISKKGDLIIVQNIVFPDIKIQHEKNKAEHPVCVAFLSDIHIGSNMFMDNEWNAFLKWINGNLGNSRQKGVASKIKYLILPGDLVDGIGIYPNQEEELSISNIYKQYEVLSKHLEHIPEHITMVLQPGNHDAVRPAEPQPAFEKEIQDLFTGREFIFVGNPCYLSLHGVEILSYHGQSLLDFSTNIQNLNYNEPTEVMKVMLKKRHLSPAYGGYTPLAPEHYDYMIIDKVPDIFVTGHVHIANIDNYRGVTLINASSWQAQTSYQKMLNFIPESAKLPIINLQTGNATTMDFNEKIT
ncbi:MAG: DNA-directed DNA polymerase II small subunit [Thermoplasmatales archaeon]|nr:MAG: DNA-directed DNA polymerase II small subunit [Thermoplasmatales archaeon]